MYGVCVWIVYTSVWYRCMCVCVCTCVCMSIYVCMVCLCVVCLYVVLVYVSVCVCMHAHVHIMRDREREGSGIFFSLMLKKTVTGNLYSSGMQPYLVLGFDLVPGCKIISKESRSGCPKTQWFLTSQHFRSWRSQTATLALSAEPGFTSECSSLSCYVLALYFPLPRACLLKKNN